MGLLQDIVARAGPLAQYFSQLGVAAQVGVGFATLLVLTVTINVLRQLLFRNRNEPPLVFHWFPLIGSTITYGMDPPRFFRENRAKVRPAALQFCRADTN